VENLPDVKGYSTKDLFERHPTKPDLYRMWVLPSLHILIIDSDLNSDSVGRLDDVLTLANGEKAVPGPMEDIMDASPYIACAIMFGRERNQVGVLVEPTERYMLDPRDDGVKFLESIW
jgi:hypothetical protein